MHASKVKTVFDKLLADGLCVTSRDISARRWHVYPRLVVVVVMVVVVVVGGGTVALWSAPGHLVPFHVGTNALPRAAEAVPRCPAGS